MRPRLFAASIVAVAVALAASARAEGTSEDAKRRAAAAFDEGVTRFDKAEFLEAARAFLAADELAPNEEALKNAVASGRRANEHLLVARVAERALARGLDAPWAREAIADAAAHLARLDLKCASTNCAITVDGEPATMGVRFVLPGTHQLRARGPSATIAEERVSCVAGATYAFVLQPTAPLLPVAKELPRPGAPPVDVATPSSGLHPAFFFGLAGAAAVLTGITIWSGADAIRAKNALPKEPEAAQNDDVRGRARRTDVLLAGAGVAAIGAVAVGLWATRWGSQARATGASAFVSIGLEGASLSARGAF